nr:uncharacterized protein LOC119164179 [Rhipicephalus microplus]
MKGGITALVLLTILISSATFQCGASSAEEHAPHNVMATVNETVCESGISDTPVKAFVNWDPPRTFISPIKAYVIHFVTAATHRHPDSRPSQRDAPSRGLPSSAGRCTLSESRPCMRTECRHFSRAVLYSTGNQAYIVPAEETTTTLSSVTEDKSTVTDQPSSTTTEQRTAKVILTTEHISTAMVSSTEHSEATKEPHYSSTISNDAEPISTGVSTSTILCAVLIPLAIIVIAGLLAFGYKKYKQSGGEGLLSTSDSP